MFKWFTKKLTSCICQSHCYQGCRFEYETPDTDREGKYINTYVGSGESNKNCDVFNLFWAKKVVEFIHILIEFNPICLCVCIVLDNKLLSPSSGLLHNERQEKLILFIANSSIWVAQCSLLSTPAYHHRLLNLVRIDESLCSL